ACTAIAERAEFVQRKRRWTSGRFLLQSVNTQQHTTISPSRCVSPPYHRLRASVSGPVTQRSCIMRFFRFVPMDRVFRLLTIERLEHLKAGIRACGRLAGRGLRGACVGKGRGQTKWLWLGGRHTLSGSVNVATRVRSTACTNSGVQIPGRLGNNVSTEV